MEYNSISFVGFWSGIMSGLSALGLAVLTFGPWATSDTARLILMISLLLFSMIWTLARNVIALLAAQADQIAPLQRQLAESRARA